MATHTHEAPLQIPNSKKDWYKNRLLLIPGSIAGAALTLVVGIGIGKSGHSNPNNLNQPAATVPNIPSQTPSTEATPSASSTPSDIESTSVPSSETSTISPETLEATDASIAASEKMPIDKFNRQTRNERLEYVIPELYYIDTQGLYANHFTWTTDTGVPMSHNTPVFVDPDVSVANAIQGVNESNDGQQILEMGRYVEQAEVAVADDTEDPAKALEASQKLISGASYYVTTDSESSPVYDEQADRLQRLVDSSGRLSKDTVLSNSQSTSKKYTLLTEGKDKDGNNTQYKIVTYNMGGKDRIIKEVLQPYDITFTDKYTGLPVRIKGNIWLDEKEDIA